MGLEGLLQHEDKTVRQTAKEVLASDEWRKFKRRYSPSLINRLSNFLRNKTVEPDKEFYKNISNNVEEVAERTKSKEACTALVNYTNNETDKKLVEIVAENAGEVAKWTSSKEACEAYIAGMSTFNLDAYKTDGKVSYGLVRIIAENVGWVAKYTKSKEACEALINYANNKTDKELVKIVAENVGEVAKYTKSKEACEALVKYANNETDNELVKIIAKDVGRVAGGTSSKEACTALVNYANNETDKKLVEIVAENVGRVAENIGYFEDTSSKEVCEALINYANNKTDKELVKIVAENVGEVAKYTKSKEACEAYIAGMNTFNLDAYKTDGKVSYRLVEIIAENAGEVAKYTKSKEACEAYIAGMSTFNLDAYKINGNVDYELVKIVAKNVRQVAEHTSSKEACEMYIKVMSTVNLNAYTIDGNVDYELVKIVAENVGEVAKYTKSKETCEALVKYANNETDKKLVEIIAENVGKVAEHTSSKEACEAYIAGMSTFNLDAYKINGNVDYELVKIVAKNVRQVAIGTSSKETIISSLDILQSEKVHGRIVAKVLSGKSLEALADLHIKSYGVFDSKTAYAISRSAFEKEKSISKIQAICNGIRYVGRNEQLKGFYDAGGGISDSKYSLLSKIGIMPETAFSIFSSSLQSIFNEDIPETYSALCRELGRKENKYAKKAKALKQELGSQEGRQRELTQRRYDDALSKVQASSDNLAIGLINEMILGAYAKSLQEIVGERYAKDSDNYFRANIGDSTKIENMVNAMAMYHRIQANKPHLKQLIIDAMQGNPNRQLLEAEENRQFINGMEKRGINMQPWLEGDSLTIKLKNGIEEQLRNKEENILNDINLCRNDILKNLKSLGECYKGNTAIDDLHEYFSRLDIASIDSIRTAKEHIIARKRQLLKLRDSMADESGKNYYKTALFHIGNLVRFQAEYEGMQLDAELKGKVRVYLERDPLAILQMGNYFTDSCLATSKENAYSCVANAVDANDAVLYAEYNGEIVGRKLLKLSDDGKILQHRAFNNQLSLNMDRLFNIFVKRLAARMKTEVGDDDAKYTPTLYARKWYADGFRTRTPYQMAS